MSQLCCLSNLPGLVVKHQSLRVSLPYSDNFRIRIHWFSGVWRKKTHPSVPDTVEVPPTVPFLAASAAARS